MLRAFWNLVTARSIVPVLAAAAMLAFTGAAAYAATQAVREVTS